MTKYDISKLILSCAVSSSLVMSTVLPGAAAFAEGASTDAPAAQGGADAPADESGAEAVPSSSVVSETELEAESEAEGPVEGAVESAPEGDTESEGAGGPEGSAEGETGEPSGSDGSPDAGDSGDPAAEGGEPSGEPSGESADGPNDSDASADEGGEPSGESSDESAEEKPAADETAAPASLPASEALSFVYVDQDTRAGECGVNVAFFLSSGKAVSEAALDMVVDEGSEVQAYASAVSGSAVAFRLDASQIQGSYVTFAKLTVAFADGTSQVVDLTAEQDEGMGYGFYAAAGMSAGNSLMRAALYDDGSDSASELSFYAIDGDSLVEAASLSDAIATAEAGTEAASLATAQYSNIVIALDAGHDSTLHPGASAQGYKEAEITLKIAQYCKAELETYPGVTVYMVRDGASCPYPGASSEAEELQLRVQGAVEAGACVYVSIHMNSYTKSTASGAEVWYPNSSLNTVVQDVAKELSQDILDQLVDLGLVDRGTKQNSSLSSGEDYYSIIRNSKRNGIPGIIVEHAFLTSTTDVEYFSTDEALQRLGVADATGIAGYFGLSKDGTTDATVIQGGVVEASRLDEASGAFDIVASSVNCTNGVSSVAVALECQENDAAGVRWYQLANQGDGTWKATVSLKDFGVESGTFSVQGYLCDSDWTSRVFCKTSFKVGTLDPDVVLKSTWDNATQSYVLTGSEGSVAEATNVAFAVTGAQGGTVWYQATRDTDGSWSAPVPRSAHGPGPAAVSVWATVAGSTSQLASATVTFPDDGPVTEGTVSVYLSDDSASFRVVGSGGSFPRAEVVYFHLVDVAGDSYWLEGEHQGDGSWEVLVPVGLLPDGSCVVAASGVFDGETSDLGSTEFTAELHPIMNASPAVTVAQMVAHFKANGGTYPEVYATKGAATIEDFCTILVEEAKAEGVDPVVVFSQAMVETGYLSFGRKVAAEQCNFCGLGAGGADSHGLTFASVREGLRAQVQHLKAYGSTEDLVNPCIDERFGYVARGCAPYVESLGGRWATSSTYGFNLSKIIDSIL